MGLSGLGGLGSGSFESRVDIHGTLTSPSPSPSLSCLLPPIDSGKPAGQQQGATVSVSRKTVNIEAKVRACPNQFL